MRTQDIIIGKYYRHIDHPSYAWAKPIQLLQPKTGINKTTHAIFKCEWTVDKNDSFGLIKYFSAPKLVQPK